MQALIPKIRETVHSIILHFTVVCLVAKPLNRSETRIDFVVTQTLLLFICKSLCYHARGSIIVWRSGCLSHF